MSTHINNFSKKVADNLLLSYAIGLIIGTVAFIIIILLHNWKWDVLIEEPSLLSLTSVSGVFLKFLSGIGIMITYSTACILIFRIFSSFIKGKKKRAETLKFILIILASFICGYGVYNIIKAFLYETNPIILFFQRLFNPPQSLWDVLLDLLNKFTSLIFGLWSLIIFVYGIPIIREQYNPIKKETIMEKIRGKFGGFKYSIWRGYQKRIRKDFGKVFAAQYERYKTDIEDIRDQLSGLLLIPFAFILLSFPMLIGIVIVLWIRIFSLDYKIYNFYERILLIFTIIGVLVVGTIIFLFANLEYILPFFDISYGIGICSSAFILGYIIYRS
ncbi:MAG: hypothetical protein ACTSO9_19210 [Candidatus Helarchaeota archaeon]